MKKYIATLLALILALSTTAALAAAEIPEPAQVGLEAPDFELKMPNGETFRLSEQRGKVVFLNIWATWCPPCVAEMPDIEALSKAHPDDLVVIGVSCDDSEDEMVKFIEAQGYTYNFAWDADYSVASQLYPTYAIPNSVFIDANGIVTSIEMGAASYAVMEQRYLDAKAHAEEAPETGATEALEADATATPAPEGANG